MEQIRILSENSPERLQSVANNLVAEGYKRVGDMHVVTTHMQNRFRGNDLVDAVYRNEYTLMMVKETE